MAGCEVWQGVAQSLLRLHHCSVSRAEPQQARHHLLVQGPAASHLTVTAQVSVFITITKYRL